MKEKNQKRFESLSDEIFELEEKYDLTEGVETETKRRKYFKSKIVRLNLALDDLKKDMNYKDPGVDNSDSEDSLFTI